VTGGGEDDTDLTCVVAGCTRNVPNRERCTPCENVYNAGKDDGRVRGRQEIQDQRNKTIKVVVVGGDD